MQISAVLRYNSCRGAHLQSGHCISIAEQRVAAAVPEGHHSSKDWFEAVMGNAVHHGSQILRRPPVGDV